MFKPCIPWHVRMSMNVLSLNTHKLFPKVTVGGSGCPVTVSCRSSGNFLKMWVVKVTSPIWLAPEGTTPSQRLIEKHELPKVVLGQDSLKRASVRSVCKIQPVGPCGWSWSGLWLNISVNVFKRSRILRQKLNIYLRNVHLLCRSLSVHQWKGTQAVSFRFAL